MVIPFSCPIDEVARVVTSKYWSGRMNQFECVVPILNVKNFAASMDYYLGKLGFTKKWD